MDKNISRNITENIKVKFTKIKEKRNKIKDKFIQIQKMKNEIKQNYVNYIQKEKEDFFGLDSFHFQNKVIDLEFENMMKLYKFIDNRIYGDYYKLFTEIQKFLKQNLKPKQLDVIKEIKNYEIYPAYKDLDKFKTYDFDTINNIHQDIIIIISSVKEIHHENELIIKEDMKQLSLGLNIDNYIINTQYKNMVLLTTNTKFENYLQVYHKYHFDLLTKFGEKLSLCYQHIIQNNSKQTTPEQTSKIMKTRESLAFSSSESEMSDENENESMPITPQSSNESPSQSPPSPQPKTPPPSPKSESPVQIIAHTYKNPQFQNKDFSTFYDPSENGMYVISDEQVQTGKDNEDEEEQHKELEEIELDEHDNEGIEEEKDTIDDVSFVESVSTKKRKKRKKKKSNATPPNHEPTEV